MSKHASEGLYCLDELRREDIQVGSTCGNVIGLCKAIGSDTIMMCVFVEAGVVFLEKKYVTMEVGFEVSDILKSCPVRLSSSCYLLTKI